MCPVLENLQCLSLISHRILVVLRPYFTIEFNLNWTRLGPVLALSSQEVLEDDMREFPLVMHEAADCCTAWALKGLMIIASV